MLWSRPTTTLKLIIIMNATHCLDRIGPFPSDLVLSAPSDQKQLKIFQLFIGRKSQVQTGTENWYRKPICVGFNFVPIRSDSMLIFLNGNRPLLEVVLKEILSADAYFPKWKHVVETAGLKFR